MMETNIHITVFYSPTEPLGYIEGKYIVVDNLKIGDLIKFYDDKKYDWFCGHLKITDIYTYSFNGEYGMMLEDVVAPSLAEAQNFAKALENDFGLFLNSYL